MKHIDLPTQTVTLERIDYDKVLKMLEKGPTSFNCSYEQAKVINTYVRNKLQRGLSMHQSKFNGEVLGYTLSLTEISEERATAAKKAAKKRKVAAKKAAAAAAAEAAE